MEELSPMVERPKVYDENNANEKKCFVEALKLFANEANDAHERHQIVSDRTKEDFNVFSCLTRHHLEELHSKFICYLLNPKEGHNCGDVFLKIFLEVISQNESIDDKLGNLEQYLLANAIVEREVNVGDGNELYGFIDIFIETEKFCIVIENKIHAREQPKQIERYAKHCRKKNKSFVCLYLTPFGNYSSESGNEEYFPISYERQIIMWLESCIEKMRFYPIVTSGIHFYLNTLKASILKQPSKIIMELKEFLLEKDNAIILKYLDDLNNAIVPVRNQLRTIFFENLATLFKRHNIKVEPYPGSVGEIWNKMYQGFYFTDSNLTLEIDNGKVVYLELQHDWDSLYFGLLIYPRKGAKDWGMPFNPNEYKEAVNKIESQLSEVLPYQIKSIDNVWFAWKEFKVLNKSFIFGSDALNYDFSVNIDKIIEEFESEIIPFIREWKIICEKEKQVHNQEISI